jgi:Protein of unknown function (DUF2911)
MKKAIYLIIPFAMIACGGDNAEEETTEGSVESTEETTEEVEDEVVERKSPRTQASGSIADLSVDVDYGSPRVKDRDIWGDLIAYDKVWRAGADEVTAITFSSNAIFGGSEIEAGTYGMFIIPKEKGDWTFILNEEWSQEEHGVWGAYDYKEEKDVLRVDVTPEWVKDTQEEMAYSITEDGYLKFAWEFVTLKVAISSVDPV